MIWKESRLLSDQRGYQTEKKELLALAQIDDVRARGKIFCQSIGDAEKRCQTEGTIVFPNERAIFRIVDR